MIRQGNSFLLCSRTEYMKGADRLTRAPWEWGPSLQPENLQSPHGRDSKEILKWVTSLPTKCKLKQNKLLCFTRVENISALSDVHVGDVLWDKVTPWGKPMAWVELSPAFYTGHLAKLFKGVLAFWVYSIISWCLPQINTATRLFIIHYSLLLWMLLISRLSLDFPSVDCSPSNIAA